MNILEICSKYQPLFLTGAVMTIVLSFVSVSFSIVFGSLLSMMKISNFMPAKWLSNAYVEFIRGTPLLVQIYMVFYGLPMLGINLPSITLFGINFERLIAGILALTINSSAYVCEIVRGGILSIDTGQMEAARSLGFNKSESMMFIVLPQAVKNILPALGNEFISLIKSSSQVSVIGIGELMYEAQTIRSISYRPFAPLVIISIIYFLITSVVSHFVKKFEAKLAISSKRQQESFSVKY